MMYKKGKDYFSSFVSGLVSSFLRPNKPFFSAGLFSEDSVAACCTSSTMSRPEYYAKMVAHTLNDKEIVVFKRTLRLETKKVDDIEDTPEAIMQ